MSKYKKIIEDGRRDIISDSNYDLLQEDAGDLVIGGLYAIGVFVLIIAGLVGLINLTMC